MINILLDDLPESVDVGGDNYPVDWGYRAMILIEMCIFDQSRDVELQVLDALNIFYMGNIPPDISAAMERLLWFRRCGREEKKPNGGQADVAKHARQSKRVYCFDQDAPYIYAAFLSQYGIDLNKTPDRALHWWKFNAMFEALGEDQKISKIMYYRTAPLTGLSKERRKFLNEMKKLYALESPDQTVDSRMKLAQRNADMKDYVQRRAAEVENAES